MHCINVALHVCDCRTEYLFNFDNAFEIHDDIEVLRRMGMMMGLESGQCGNEDVRKALRMVPQALEHYVVRKSTLFTVCFIYAVEKKT